MEPQFFRPVVDDNAAYRDALRRAEENGVITDSNGEVVEQETPAVIELEGAVPVQASDQPLDPEPVVEETPDTPEQQQEEQHEETLFAGKYKSAEDLEKAHLELQQKLGDPNRLDLENRRLQEKLDELSAKIDAQQVQPVTQQAPDVQITQELIDNDPEEATLLAFRQGNQAALQIAFKQWKAYDSDTANLWLQDQRLAEQRREFDAKLEQVQKSIEDRTAPIAQQQEEQAQNLAWVQAFDTAKLGRPDFIENAERLLAEVAPQHPSYLPLLQSADPKVKADALVALYAIDKIGNPEAVAQQLGEKAKEAVAEAATALAAGAVVSGQPTAGQNAVEQSDEELEVERMLARQRSKPSLTKGWTGRS